jgi:Holliday junction resolvasome RuvABC endonuclease subunit
MTGRILGIDPGSSSGYGYGLPGDAPKSGTIRLDSGMSNGRRFATLEGRIRNIISVHEIDYVYVEAPYINPVKLDINAVRLSYGYQAAILLACEKEGIMAERIFLVPPSEWRSAVLGVTEMPGLRKKKAPGEQRDPGANREWLKQQAIMYCDKRGWPIRSQDEAEACCIWEYGCETTVPASTLNRLPLFDSLPL